MNIHTQTDKWNPIDLNKDVTFRNQSTRTLWTGQQNANVEKRWTPLTHKHETIGGNTKKMQ